MTSPKFDMTTDTTTILTDTLSSVSLDTLLNTHFAGKVVRKDLTKLIKEGANVPVYVLEYLLGMYCASDDEAVIQKGLINVKRILAENYVRPDEAEKVKSKVRESGTYKVIDKITVRLNEKRDVYEALLSNLGVKTPKFLTLMFASLKSCLWAAFGASSLSNTILKKTVHLLRSLTSNLSRCPTWIWRLCSMRASYSQTNNGSMP